ncbi:MAG: D-3-phosphoglycerate dehydrogenase [uncultured Thermomicrobiales bacterium]|uniref:D-3-phosphoglycerate dehydrogenase n=1 Tax=uncultured Thermomicrobiales bacterium TaxID=1645740 RepID=A0A6J4V911_9BACT|nr:MAG: D-3-phosphoglycerate dehydrogenase [uncultured Thermomicrobiales bacterium]
MLADVTEANDLAEGAMGTPHIYVHRVGDWYPLYMDPDNERRLRAFATVTSAGLVTEPPSPDQLVRDLAGVDGILSLNGIGAPEITTEVLRSVGTVRVAAIAHWWHGGHVPARAMWEAAGVEVIDASDPVTEAVVEWVVGTAILGVRRLVEFDRALKGGSAWAEPGRRDAGLLGASTIGIIGLGRVGRVAAARFRPFGARLIGYDPWLPAPDAAALGVRLVGLEELLRTADVVSLHMPPTDATRGMLGARELGWLKDGAVLINSARAALLDEVAFIAELRSGRFRAFLDVFDDEPLPLDHPFRSLENVFITPHIAGDTTGMFRSCARLALDRLRDYFAG